jgi:citrate lyase beta subunit
MLIVSQNISQYSISFPNDVIYRINLAWINNLQELERLLKKHDKQKIFLDLPINRIKPPNNKYSLDDIVSILNSYENIKYFAISNVNNANDLESYNDLIPKNVTIVPKIESPDGISNVSEIVQAIPGQEKILMLDHDDLFSALTKLNESPDKFKDYINELVEFCKENNTILLRTIGVIFSDEEKRITEYVN